MIGAGYVGLVTGACFAELGNHVTCVDVNEHKINNLQKGVLPIYEPGLEPMVAANMSAGRLQFTTSLAAVAEEPHAFFIAVGTPSGKDGSAEIKYVLEAARNIGERMNQPCVIVDKSTVPVGMADQVRDVIQKQLDQRRVSIFDVVSNQNFCLKARHRRFHASRSRHHWFVIRPCKTNHVRSLSTNFTQSRTYFFHECQRCRNDKIRG